MVIIIETLVAKSLVKYIKLALHYISVLIIKPECCCVCPICYWFSIKQPGDFWFWITLNQTNQNQTLTFDDQLTYRGLYKGGSSYQSKLKLF